MGSGGKTRIEIDPEASLWKFLPVIRHEELWVENLLLTDAYSTRDVSSCRNIFDNTLNTVINLPGTFSPFDRNYVK